MKMRFNHFWSGEKYKVQAVQGTDFDSVDSDSASDDAHSSLDERETVKGDSSLDEEAPPGTNDVDRMKNESFQYPEIDPTTFVRLLRITKATKWAVEGHFKQVAVADLPWTNYIALSYTWGKAKADQDVHAINIGGQAFYVRNNLWNFFISTGQQCRAKFLYVDAICTNQRNMEERGHQVKFMSDVYANADCVYVWLGKPLPTQADNLKALRKQLSRAAIGSWDRHAMFGLSYLCSVRYWSRLWIVQELLLAKAIVVYCGETRFDFDELAKLQRESLIESDLVSHKKLDWWTAWVFGEPGAYSQQENAEDNICKNWEYALRIFDHRGKWKQRMKARGRATPGSTVLTRDCGLPLYKAVHYFREQQCQDPRDKIYALVGLLEEVDKRDIKPSYTNSHQQVYKQALEVGLLSLQRNVEPKALANGYYPQEDYKTYAQSLRDILGLEWRAVQQVTMEALRAREFRQNFVYNCRSERALKWPVDKPLAETESDILHEFFMLGDGKKSFAKTIGLLLDIQGKHHLPSAALSAARSELFDKIRFVNQDQKQGVSYRAVGMVARVWQRTIHFRRWTPFERRKW